MRSRAIRPEPTRLTISFRSSWGGSNDIANLWPQPAHPAPGFHEKDKVETALHDEVCKAHTMTLDQAQRLIATDWLTYYNEKVKKQLRPGAGSRQSFGRTR